MSGWQQRRNQLGINHKRLPKAGVVRPLQESVEKLVVENGNIPGLPEIIDPYPVICPMCEQRYYNWYIHKKTVYSLTGEFSKEVVEYIDYIHDDGIICSRPWRPNGKG